MPYPMRERAKVSLTDRKKVREFQISKEEL